MAIFDKIYSDSFYLITDSGEKLFPFQQKRRSTGRISFRVGRESSHNSLTHKDPSKRALELEEHEMFDYEPYRVCRRVNILRDYPDDKIKIYP